MKLTETQKAWVNVAQIVAVCAIMAVLICINPYSALALPIAVLYCRPLVIEAWKAFDKSRNKPLKLLWSALRKIEGLTIDKHEWDEEGKRICIDVTFHKFLFKFHVNNDTLLAHVILLPWGNFDAKNDDIYFVLEAINLTNAKNLRSCLMLTEPLEDNKRCVVSQTTFALPRYATDGFVESLLVDMLNSGHDLMTILKNEGNDSDCNPQATTGTTPFKLDEASKN